MPRSRRATPLEYDLLDFLVGVIAAPVVLPALMLRFVAEAVEEQARCETDIEAMLRGLPEEKGRPHQLIGGN